ncbi:MAG: YfhO family protein [Nitrospirota bacterium]
MNQIIKDRALRLLPFFTLLSITLLFFANALSPDWTFGYGDIHRYFYPIRCFTATAIKEGFLPLWNPYLFAGIPNLAALQPAVFYPVSILPYLFPFFLGIKLFIIVHFFLAGIFTYLLMRHLKVSKTGALVSAITYGFGGFLLSVVDMLTTLSAATWTPVIFLCYFKALGSDLKYGICPQIPYSRSDPNKYLIFTGLFLGIQFLAGEPTQLYGTLIALSLYTVAKVWQMWSRETKAEKSCLHETCLRVVKFCFRGLTPWLICLGLTLFQILPFLEMVLHSTRTSGLKFTHATSLSLGPHELLNLVLPYWSGNFIEKSHFWFGQSWLESIYLGILPLLFAFIAGVFGRRKRMVSFFTGIIFIFLLLSIGNLLPLYHLLYQYLPGFSMLRYPVKFFSFVVFGISILAGFGYDYLIPNIKEKGDKILKIFSGFILIYAGSFLVFFLNQQRIIPFLKRVYFPNALDIQIDAWMNSLLGNFMFVCLITIAGILLISLLFKEKISTKVFNLGIIGLVIIDLFIFGVRINPVVSQEIYACKSPGLRFLLQDTDCYRILLEPKSEKYFRIIRGDTLEDALIGVQNSLVSNYGLFYRIFDTQGYESLTLNDYTRFLKVVTEQGKWNLLDGLNIKYVVSKFDLKMRQLKLVYEDETIKIYWNTACLPRAFFVPKARIIKDRQRILEEMKGVDFDPRKEVILEEKFEIRNSKFEIRNSKFEIIKYQPNKVIITASSPTDCFLFLSDTYYPGWRAFIDGKPTKIYRANYTFRAISFPKGTHTVEFRYLPLSFLVGVVGSGMTVVILIGLILIWRKRERKGERGEWLTLSTAPGILF